MHTSIAIVSTQLNYCYLTLLILLNMNYLLADSEVVTSILNYSFICTQSNDSKNYYVNTVFQFTHTVKFQVLLLNI